MGGLIMQTDFSGFTLLIVDDEEDIAALLQTVLVREGFSRILTAATVRDGLEAFIKYKPDLVLLDIMLPDGNGYELFSAFQQIREVPILFISAKDEEVDRLLGFALGAQDYITKPFSPKEVAYRVKARLKSGMSVHRSFPIEPVSEVFKFGDVCIDYGAGTVKKEDVVIDFTAKELKLLMYLTKHPNRILSKEQICQGVWGEDFIGFDNTISVHIRKIRLKIEENPSNPQWIQTVIGLGYKFVCREASFES
jgi:two-component system response regulator VicR